MYSAHYYEVLFQQLLEGPATPEELRMDRVERFRTKTIKSGEILEAEIYPIWKTQKQATEAKQLKAKSREAQQNLNDKNAKKAFERLINENFTQQDIFVTLSYAGRAPDMAQARRDMQNYIRRIKTARRQLGLPEMKYAYVIEFEEEGHKRRIHPHIIMSGMDRDLAEQCWGKGRANSCRLQPDRYGLTALSIYVLKAPRGSRRWAASKNLKKPTETESVTKISRRKVERMAEDLETFAPKILQKVYPGYIFLDVEIKRSDYVAGAYIYARMRKIPEKKPGKREVKARGKKNE